jgi:hypothetical protein
MAACLLIWGCAASQPQKEITAAFQAFLADVKAGNQEKILAAAPFLTSLDAGQREKALEPFRMLAGEGPGNLKTEVSRGAGDLYLLRVSAPGQQASLVVPFIRRGQGQWEMSPVISAIQHIDVVPAR